MPHATPPLLNDISDKMVLEFFGKPNVSMKKGIDSMLWGNSIIFNIRNNYTYIIDTGYISQYLPFNRHCKQQD